MRAERIQNKKQILLINEKSDTQLFVDFQEKGCEVTVCESPQKAWGFVCPIPPGVNILHLQHLSSKDIYALEECLALADGVPVIIATGASRSEAFTKELRRIVPRFLSLPLKPDAVGEILDGLESSISDRRPESEWRKQF